MKLKPNPNTNFTILTEFKPCDLRHHNLALPNKVQFVSPALFIMIISVAECHLRHGAHTHTLSRVSFPPLRVPQQEKRIFTNFHRQLFCWIDKWVDLTMEDIRRMEAETQKELEEVCCASSKPPPVVHRPQTASELQVQQGAFCEASLLRLDGALTERY